jgi:hypothetical protein
MHKTFTLDDLILFAYNETGNEKSAEIIKALGEDEEFLEEYESIIDVQHQLDSIKETPSRNVIDNILNYSKALNVFKLKPPVETGFAIVN